MNSSVVKLLSFLTLSIVMLFSLSSPVMGAEGYTLLCKTGIPVSADGPANHRLPDGYPGNRYGYISNPVQDCNPACNVGSGSCTVVSGYYVARYKCSGYGYQNITDNGVNYSIPGCLNIGLVNYEQRTNNGESLSAKNIGGECDVTYQVDLISNSTNTASAFMVYHSNSNCNCNGARPRFNLKLTNGSETGWLEPGNYSPPSGVKITSIKGLYFDGGTGVSLAGTSLNYVRLNPVNEASCIADAYRSMPNSYDAYFAGTDYFGNNAGCTNAQGHVLDGTYQMSGGSNPACAPVNLTINSGVPPPTPTATVTATPTATPTPTPCPNCTETACQPGTPSSKYRTTPQTQTGSRTACSNPAFPACPTASTVSCNYTNYINTAPSCSIKINGSSGPAVISRNDPVANIELTVTDPDYGDTVEISTYDVQDATATQIKNDNADCGLVRSSSGADPFGLVVRVGSDNTNVITQTTNILFDQQRAHGVYTYNSGAGRFECSGTLKIEVKDKVGDSGDSSFSNTCSIQVTVVNEQPVVTNLEILDKDEDTSVRTAGNHINGTNQNIWISNAMFQSSRSKKCSSPVDLNTAGFPCPTSTSALSRKNPIDFSVTIQDGNGAKDIERVGIFLQNINPAIAGTTTDLIMPPASSGIQRSISALYGQFQDETIASNVYWVSRADFSKTLDNAATKLYGNRFWTSPGGVSTTQRAQFLTYRGWAQKFFPDCYLFAFGCGAVNTPSGANIAFNTNDAVQANYIYDVESPANTFLCYNNSLAPVIKTGSCDSSCSACISRSTSNSGIQQIGTDKIKASFTLQVNDPLLEGNYAMFIIGSDKVGTNINKEIPLHRTDIFYNSWSRITRNQGICENANPSACSNLFLISLDKTAPSFTAHVDDFDTSDDLIFASVNNVADAGSGVSSANNIYRTVFYWVNKADPTQKGFIKSARSGEGFCNGNTTASGGLLPCSAVGDLGPIAGQWEMGGNLADSNIPAGVTVDIFAEYCIMDNAGNGNCVTSAPFTATSTGASGTAWIKTSLGPVYSNTLTTANPFDIRLTADPAFPDLSSSSLLYAPYVSQQKSIVSSYVGTSSSSSDLGLQNAQLGVSPLLRNPADTNAFTKRSFFDPAGSRFSGGWYARLLSLFEYNCNKTGSSVCVNHPSAQAAMSAGGSAPNYVIVNGNATLNTLTCSGKSMVFVAGGTLTINGQINRNAGAVCVIVVASGATLEIADTANATVDKVYATMIVDGNFRTNSLSPAESDRLEIFGSVFSSTRVPLFNRKLSEANNKSYPAEWIVYNATPLDLFRNWFGVNQVSDIKCGASGHPVCL